MFRAAVQISGQPRVSAVTSKLAQQLVADSVDWYVHFWSDNPPPDSVYVRGQHVHDQWRRPVDREWVLNKFKQNLPAHHTVVEYVHTERPKVTWPDYIKPEFADLHSVYTMWQSWRIADDLRRHSGREYDLVVRARPDCALTAPLDLSTVDPNVITICNGIMDAGQSQWDAGRTVKKRFADLMHMGKGDLITASIGVIEGSYTVCKRQPLHPDTAMAAWLTAQGITISRGLWDIAFRQGETDWGTWIDRK